MGYQKFTIETILGKSTLYAPEGWEFDKTAVEVWWHLLMETTDMLASKGKNGRKAQRFMENRLERIDALACVLADSLGMASHYWVMQAQTLAITQAKNRNENS